MKPEYTDAAENDRVDAWLERRGQRFPLKRVDELDLEPIVLPGAPTTGAEAAAAQQLAERADDVRLAAALLHGAAAQADLAFNTTKYIPFLPLEAQRAWARPLIASRAPLLAIIKACDAFEDVFAGRGQRAAPASELAAAESSTPGDLAVAAAVRPHDRTFDRSERRFAVETMPKRKGP